MARKTKSSLLAQGIELIESGVKKIKEFNDNIDPFLLDAEKLKQIRPLIDNLSKTLMTDKDKADQEKADQEKADQEKADQEKADQEKADTFNMCDTCVHTPDKPGCEPEGCTHIDGKVKVCPGFKDKADQEKANQEKADRDILDACYICVHPCEPDLRPEGVVIDDGKVKSCPNFTLKPEPTTPKRKFNRMVRILNAQPKPD